MQCIVSFNDMAGTVETYDAGDRNAYVDTNDGFLEVAAHTFVAANLVRSIAYVEQTSSETESLKVAA